MTSARQAEDRMTVDAFMTWCEQQPDGKRFELLDGLSYMMSSAQALHARVKRKIANLLEQAIVSKDLPCEVFGDGMAVRVDDETVFEPDALVVCGTPVPATTVLIEAPIIVVEVGSPSTQRIDATVKLARYFRNPNIVHYLMIVPTAQTIIHHHRTATGKVETTSHIGGALALDPPGLEIVVDDVFSGMAV